jgi:inhibitor of cysteine peptidase
MGAASAAVVTAGASDNGGSIKLKKGDTLELTLPTNASTGYDWTVLPDSTPLLKLQSHTSKRSSGGQLGAPGMATYRFAATAKGTGDLTMQYSRAWEHSPQADKKFVLHINIQ